MKAGSESPGRRAGRARRPDPAAQRLQEEIAQRRRAEEDLEQLAFVIRRTRELVNIATLDGRMVFLNEAGGEMLGVAPDEVERTNIMQVIPDHLKAMVQGELLPTLAKGGVWEGDLQYRNLKTGKLTDVHAMTFTVSDSATGAPLFLANVSLDITSRKRVEDALRASERRYRTIVENITDALYILDFDGNIIDVNDAACTMLGYERSELVGANLSKIYREENLRQMPERMGRLLAEGALLFEGRHRRRDGSLIPVEVSAKVVSREEGGIIHAFVRDITERDRVRHALETSHSLLNAALESTADGILVVDVAGRVARYNRKFLDLWRIPDALAALGDDQKLIDYVLEQLLDPEGFVTKVRELYTNVEASSMDDLVFKDGRVFERYSQPERMGDKIVGRVWSFRDVTERRRAEEELRRHRANLEDLVRERTAELEEKNARLAEEIAKRTSAEEALRKHRDQLEELVKQRSEDLVEAYRKLAEAKRLSDIGALAATVAHELRNPLSVMQAAAYNLRRKSKEPALEKHIGSVEKKVTESNQIIDNLLRYARIKGPELERSPIGEAVAESIRSAKARFPGQKMVIRQDLGGLRGVLIEMDVVQIKEVLDNILNNAYQALVDMDGRVTVTGVLGDDGTVEISIADNGPGIDEADLARVFEPFFSRKAKGTGLGLAICKELVQLHGGTVSIASSKGSGTSVCIRLPLARAGR